VALAASTASATARAADPKDPAACKEAYETSQESRKGGSLLTARTKLRLCASESCPDIVRTDCMTWLAEVEKAVPSVVLEARAEGQIVLDASVTMDGKPFATKLDGRPVDVDPGVHVFVFEKPGKPPVEQKVIVREGQKSILVSGSWEAPKAARPQPAVEAQQGSSGWRTVGFVAGALGIVGLGVGSAFGVAALSADKTASGECQSSTVCTQPGADDSRTAHQRATVSTVSFAAGGALFVGGALLVLFAPHGTPTQGRIVVAPGFTASSQELFVTGAF
jgi:hypothetical protein